MFLKGGGQKDSTGFMSRSEIANERLEGAG